MSTLTQKLQKERRWRVSLSLAAVVLVAAASITLSLTLTRSGENEAARIAADQRPVGAATVAPPPSSIAASAGSTYEHLRSTATVAPPPSSIAASASSTYELLRSPARMSTLNWPTRSGSGPKGKTPTHSPSFRATAAR
jgi:hypothetical protein